MINSIYDENDENEDDKLVEGHESVILESSGGEFPVWEDFY